MVRFPKKMVRYEKKGTFESMINMYNNFVKRQTELGNSDYKGVQKESRQKISKAVGLNVETVSKIDNCTQVGELSFNLVDEYFFERYKECFGYIDKHIFEYLYPRTKLVDGKEITTHVYIFKKNDTEDVRKYRMESIENEKEILPLDRLIVRKKRKLIFGLAPNCSMSKNKGNHIAISKILKLYNKNINSSGNHGYDSVESLYENLEGKRKYLEIAKKICNQEETIFYRNIPFWQKKVEDMGDKKILSYYEESDLFICFGLRNDDQFIITNEGDPLPNQEVVNDKIRINGLLIQQFWERNVPF